MTQGTLKETRDTGDTKNTRDTEDTRNRSVHMGHRVKKFKKEGNFGLPRKIRKECANEFTTMADCVVSRKKLY